MLERSTVLALRSRFSPMLLHGDRPSSTRIVPCILFVHHARVFSERRIVVVEDARKAGACRQHLANDDIGLSNLCGTMFTPTIGFEPAEATHELGPAIVVAVDP